MRPSTEHANRSFECTSGTSWLESAIGKSVTEAKFRARLIRARTQREGEGGAVWRGFTTFKENDQRMTAFTTDFCQHQRCASGRKRPRTSLIVSETAALQTLCSSHALSTQSGHNGSKDGSIQQRGGAQHEMLTMVHMEESKLTTCVSETTV